MPSGRAEHQFPLVETNDKKAGLWWLQGLLREDPLASRMTSVLPNKLRHCSRWLGFNSDLNSSEHYHLWEVTGFV